VAGGSGGNAPVSGNHSGGAGSPAAGGATGGSGGGGQTGGGGGGMASAGGGVGGAMAGSGGSGPGAGSGGQGMQPNGGSGGAGGSGGSTAKRFSCPAGPFPTPMVMSTKNVCGSFAFSHSWNEGPTWIASQKAFFFTNFVALSGSGGDIIKYTPGGNCEVYIGNVGCNGLAASNDGNLLAACQQTRSVVRFDLATKRATPVAETYMGMQLDTPNDLVQHSNGSVYFTNPTNELDGRPVGVGPGAFRVDPSGTVSMIRQGNCNGIALSPDEKKLYVVLSGMWDLDAEGVPSNQEQLFTTGDGMGIDCAGNVYANGSIFTPDGDSIGSWGKGTNLAFGGEDGKTVLVAGPGRELRELTVNVPGLP
jgi:gluconolactonase